MEVLDLALGCQLYTSLVFPDSRGFFLETFRESWIPESGFKQQNMSFSEKGVVRGLHRQNMPMAQGKFVRCLQGRITDVAVDPLTGEVMVVELDSPNKAAWIPGHLNHGFWAHERSLVMYLCTEYFSKEHETGIHPLSKELDLPWKHEKDLIISPKDLLLPEFSSVK